MISIDDHPPPDPSSSSHHHHHHHQHHHDLHINGDEKASVSATDLKSTDAPHELPSFSIRDYVFGSRSKNVACNWPFSRSSLQLCLKHGVKNLLPPFQSLDNSSVTSRLPDEEIETISSFEEHLAHAKAKEKPPVSTQIAVKKRRSVMKLNSNSGVEPVEEVAPTSFIVSETMASKVCPVCKTFSSSSNTTLNAHIDQCLSGESSMKWAAHPKVIVKHRIKPRKTRLMVDVYETAPCCTVEELDRRNGTSWATNSSFPAQEFQFQGEEEKEEPKTTTTINPEVADHEGDVYIDGDGTKVRILSVPKAGSSHNHGATKLLKGGKESKIIVGKKKGDIHKQKHPRKFLKLSTNSKTPCLPKPHRAANSEARNGGEEGVAINGAQVHMKMDDLAIIRPPWACSKRTGLVKKNRKVELRHLAKDLRVESDKCSSGSGSRTPPSSSDNMASSQSGKKTRTSSPLMVELSTHLNDDGGDIRLKGCKFSSLRKNLSIPAAKFNLKRKFSAFKKSGRYCLLNEKGKTDAGPSQDSSNKQMEEDPAATKNKETRIHGDERLIEDREQESTGLTNSLVPEFSKPAGQPDNKFDSYVDLHQDQLCSTNRAPDGKNIFGNDLEDNTYNFENHEGYFLEVDPISIPGPPGSFLPSPGGDMVSEELHSSLTTTSRVQSGENQHHHDIIDRDSMSNSPISTVSESKSFKNDQPCCCSRKEGALNYQDSSLFRKRTAELNKTARILSLRPDMFSLGNHAPGGSAIKLPVYSDCDSAASPSKPVLRLMGKDLTVVQTDEEISPQSRQLFRTVQKEEHISYAHGYPQGPIGFSQYQYGFEPQRFDARPSLNMRNHFSARPVHVHGHENPHMGPTTARFNQVRERNMHAATFKPAKEIIIIDDSPENEAEDDEHMRRIRASPAGQMNSLYAMYQPQAYGGGGGCGLPVFRGGGSPVFQTSLGNGNLGRWNCTPAVGSSGMMLRSPAPPPSQLRSSAAYYHPGYP